MPDIKLMVLGNGRVGKTQICRRLRGEPYDENVSRPPTASLVTSAPLPAVTDGGAGGCLHIWDFGGQDIYHGTHSLQLANQLRAGKPLGEAW